MEPVLQGISEIVLMVEDVRASAAFYQRTLGFEPEMEVTDEWAWFRMGPPDRPQRIALHRGSLYFEEHSPRPAGQRWGQIHYALQVGRESLDAALNRARTHGVEVYGPIRLGWMKANAHYLYDPDGNLIELWSPDPKRSEVDATSDAPVAGPA